MREKKFPGEVREGSLFLECLRMGLSNRVIFKQRDKTLFSTVGHPFWMVKYTWSGQTLKKLQFKDSTVEENIMMRLAHEATWKAAAQMVSELVLTQSPFWK